MFSLQNGKDKDSNFFSAGAYAGGGDAPGARAPPPPDKKVRSVR